LLGPISYLSPHLLNGKEDLSRHGNDSIPRPRLRRTRGIGKKKRRWTEPGKAKPLQRRVGSTTRCRKISRRKFFFNGKAAAIRVGKIKHEGEAAGVGRTRAA